MKRMRLIAAALSATMLLAACNTGTVLGGAGGAAGGYALGGKRGAIIGGLGGAAVGTALGQ